MGAQKYLRVEYREPTYDNLKLIGVITMRVGLNNTVSAAGMDSWLAPVYKTALAYLQGQIIEADAAPVYTTHLTGAEKAILESETLLEQFVGAGDPLTHIDGDEDVADDQEADGFGDG